MLLQDPSFNLKEYSQSRWIGVSNLEADCSVWEEAYLTSIQAYESWEKSLREWISENPRSLVIGKDDQLKDELNAMLLEIHQKGNAVLFYKERFFLSQLCKCSELLKQAIRNEQQQAELGERCAAMNSMQGDIDQIVAQIQKLLNDLTIPVEEKAALLKKLQESLANTTNNYDQQLNEANLILENAFSNNNMIFSNYLLQFQEVDMGSSSKPEEGKAWRIVETQEFFTFPHDPFVIEDARIVFQPSYYSEHEQAFKDLMLSVKKWASKISGYTYGEGDVTPAPPINEFAPPYVAPADILA